LNEEKELELAENLVKEDEERKLKKRWNVVRRLIEFERKYMQPLFGKAG
jgi:hypothetical protein